jgi:hypothetical protein
VRSTQQCRILWAVRVTISISDELLVTARSRAHERDETLDAFIATALRRELGRDGSADDHPAIPVFDGRTGPRPGIDLTSGRALHEALDEHSSST